MSSCVSPSYEIGSGVPQGSPLNPLLFIFYIADMCPKLVKRNDAELSVATATYADDTAIWANRASISSTRLVLQKRLDLIRYWCNKWRLLLNPDKCEVLVFGYYGGRPPSILLSINNTALKQVNSFKYLGVIFSPRLSWKNHLDSVSRKCKPRIGAFRNLAKKEKLPEPVLISLVGVYIASVIGYAAAARIKSNSHSNVARIRTLHERQQLCHPCCPSGTCLF